MTEKQKNVLDENGDEITAHLLSQITKWKIEANSGHNDGWTRKHYQDKLDTFKYVIDKAYDQG